MIDKRTLEFILTDQQEELKAKSGDILCNRQEEGLIDLNSPVLGRNYVKNHFMGEKAKKYLEGKGKVSIFAA